jgi:nitronate monooxygenase
MNELAASLGIQFPLIQAGMGGVATPRLAAAVASAGAGGVLALYRMRGSEVRDALRRTRALTPRPFGVNLIPELMATERLDEQVDAIVTQNDHRVFVVFYGLPDANTANRVLRARQPFIIMVGSVFEMQAAQSLGAAAVILQGTEAGGHLLGTLSLRELVAAARESGCRIPFLVAGGIGSGYAFRAYHEMGASGCVCGTIFVATEESDAHPAYKRRLVEAGEGDTVVSDVFSIGWSGRRHRVLRNRLTDEDRRLPPSFIAETTAHGRRFPIARYSATTPSAQTRGRIEEMAMYSGTSAVEIRDIVPAGRRVEIFIDQFRRSPCDQRRPL